jgi:hypothetical protein
MGPTQDLLNEFCSLGTKQGDALKQKLHKPKQWDDDQNGSSSRKQSLQSLEFIELQKRKTKLLSMLEEVYVFHELLVLKSIKGPSFSLFFSNTNIFLGP